MQSTDLTSLTKNQPLKYNLTNMKLKKLIESLAGNDWMKSDEENTTMKPHTVDKFETKETDNEGEVARMQMVKTMQAAAEIMAMIDNTSELPAWIQEKLTKIADYTTGVRHYMEMKTTRHVVSRVSESRLNEKSSNSNTIEDSDVEEIMINGMQYMLSDLKKSKLNKMLLMSDGSEQKVTKIIGNYDDDRGVYFRFKLDDGTWYDI